MKLKPKLEVKVISAPTMTASNSIVCKTSVSQARADTIRNLNHDLKLELASLTRGETLRQ